MQPVCSECVRAALAFFADATSPGLACPFAGLARVSQLGSPLTRLVRGRSWPTRNPLRRYSQFLQFSAILSLQPPRAECYFVNNARGDAHLLSRCCCAAPCDDARLSALWISTALDNVEGRMSIFRSAALEMRIHARLAGQKAAGDGPSDARLHARRAASRGSGCSQVGVLFHKPPFAPTLRPYSRHINNALKR